MESIQNIICVYGIGLLLSLSKALNAPHVFNSFNWLYKVSSILPYFKEKKATVIEAKWLAQSHMELQAVIALAQVCVVVEFVSWSLSSHAVS